jgi:mono/diheme cytochrome c family protein
MTRLTILVLFLGVAAASAEDSPGRAAFDAAGCRACHSISGVGGNSGPDLTLVGFRRTREWLDLWIKDPKAWKPDTKMAKFRLKDEDRGIIVDYLAGLTQVFPAGKAPWDGEKDAIGRGRLIYVRAGCVACHGAEGRGGHPNNNVVGNAIPAVYKAADGYTIEELKTRIRSGRKPEKHDPDGPEPMVYMPAWRGVLNEGEIADVAAYLMSLAPPKKADDF